MAAEYQQQVAGNTAVAGQKAPLSQELVLFCVRTLMVIVLAKIAGITT